MSDNKIHYLIYDAGAAERHGVSAVTVTDKDGNRREVEYTAEFLAWPSDLCNYQNPEIAWEGPETSIDWSSHRQVSEGSSPMALCEAEPMLCAMTERDQEPDTSYPMFNDLPQYEI